MVPRKPVNASIEINDDIQNFKGIKQLPNCLYLDSFD